MDKETEALKLTYQDKWGEAGNLYREAAEDIQRSLQLPLDEDFLPTQEQTHAFLKSQELLLKAASCFETAARLARQDANYYIGKRL